MNAFGNYYLPMFPRQSMYYRKEHAIRMHELVRDRVCRRSSRSLSLLYISCFGIFLFLHTACTRQPEYPPAPQIGQNIVIDASGLQPEVPNFFSYNFQGKRISYFVLKIQGKVLSFLDACSSCYPHKRGYRYKDGSITCQTCDVKFSIYQLEKGLGSCFPIKIEGKMEDGKYIIPVAALEGTADKF